MYNLERLKQEVQHGDLKEILIPYSGQSNLFILNSGLANRFHDARKSRNPQTNKYLEKSERKSHIYVGGHGIIGYVEENVWPPDIEQKGHMLVEMMIRFLSRDKSPIPPKLPKDIIMFPLLIPITLWHMMGREQQGIYMHETGGLQNKVNINGFSVEELTYDPHIGLPLFDKRYISADGADSYEIMAVNVDEGIIEKGKNITLGRILTIETILEQELDTTKLTTK